MRTLAILLVVLAGVGYGQQRRMAITVDDLPYVGWPRTVKQAGEATDRILAAFKAHGVVATAFVNETQLQVRGERDAWTELLERWIAAGHSVGNHTFSHPDYNKLEPDAFFDDIVRGDVVTRSLKPRGSTGPLYFRHPFTHTGNTPEKKEALEKFLASRGYTIAPFTVEHQDYWFASLWRRLKARGDEAAAHNVRAAYLQHLDTMLEYYEGLSRSVFQRDIAQVLLIHSNALNADCLPEMLNAMKRRGYSFVPLAEALRDPAYRTADKYVGSNGPSWLHRWAVSLGKPFSLTDEPDPPKWLLELDKATPND